MSEKQSIPNLLASDPAAAGPPAYMPGSPQPQPQPQQLPQPQPQNQPPVAAHQLEQQQQQAIEQQKLYRHQQDQLDKMHQARQQQQQQQNYNAQFPQFQPNYAQPHIANPAVPYPPAAQHQQQQPMPGQAPNVAYTTQQPTALVVMSQLQNGPSPIVCPFCQNMVTTVTTPVTGTITWVAAGFCCLFGVCCCAWIPFVADGLQDTEHTCPQCSRRLGIKNRM
ncbi:LITAF-like zinc ribbon domain-containing protein [Geranomyces variabilis]|nr:LITAF-like zinc ribbon domain-containing protein [Geranomyces variabilis]KAJ3139030.1 hypothetical protein HDU90_000936 [Geranomyces variabilis]